MKYTTEEIKTIKGHIKAIENYCKTEIDEDYDEAYKEYTALLTR